MISKLNIHPCFIVNCIILNIIESLISVLSYST